MTHYIGFIKAVAEDHCVAQLHEAAFPIPPCDQIIDFEEFDNLSGAPEKGALLDIWFRDRDKKLIARLR